MNYRTTLLLTLTTVVIFTILSFFVNLSLWWLLLPALFLIANIAAGSARINSNFFTKVYCSGPAGKEGVSITFDDGPNSEFSYEIMNTLDEYDAKATFFLIGKNITGNESLVKRMDEKGHTLGNHTFSHSTLIDFSNTASFKEEMIKTSQLVAKITGKSMRLFRPPYGVTTPAIAKATGELGYDVIGWNIRSLDTTGDSRENIYNRVVSQIRPGAIILFHDTSQKTIDILKRTLEYLRKNGIGIVPLTEMLDIRSYN